MNRGPNETFATNVVAEVAAELRQLVRVDLACHLPSTDPGSEPEESER
ncbi:MAG: hypothetical protein HYY76_08880 [Acidobacteria bacterium]|nr:hypothetical protein [Acidobacteriota bacterium]